VHATHKLQAGFPVPRCRRWPGTSELRADGQPVCARAVAFADVLREPGPEGRSKVRGRRCLAAERPPPSARAARGQLSGEGVRSGGAARSAAAVRAPALHTPAG
jgi:hypothetical protein